MTDMKVLLECKCSATREWRTVARFEMGMPALDAAKALSKLDGCEYRVIDDRWPDHSAPLITLYAAGEFVGEMAA